MSSSGLVEGNMKSSPPRWTLVEDITSYIGIPISERRYHVAVRVEDARAEGPPDVDAVADLAVPEERGRSRRCDRADDARLVAALPRIHLSAPRGPGTGRPDPEASGRAVRAEPEGPGGIRMGPGHGPPGAAGVGADTAGTIGGTGTTPTRS